MIKDAVDVRTQSKETQMDINGITYNTILLGRVPLDPLLNRSSTKDDRHSPYSFV